MARRSQRAADRCGDAVHGLGDRPRAHCRGLRVAAARISSGGHSGRRAGHAGRRRGAQRAPRRLSTRCAQRRRRAADDMASRSTASRSPISLHALPSSVAAAMASNSPRGLFSQSSQASTLSRCRLGEEAALRRCWRHGGRCRAGARASADGASQVASADGVACMAQHGHGLVRTAVSGGGAAETWR